MEKPPSKPSRRSFIKYTAIAASLFGFKYLRSSTPYNLTESPLNRPEVLGTSFSQVQCRHLQMTDAEMRDTYIKVLNLGLDIVRLGAYMDEIDERGFDLLDWQIEQAEKRDTPLIINVGVRVQRYPEFHPTSKIRDRLNLWDKPNQIIGDDPETFGEISDHAQKVISRYKNRDIIKYWQGENEAFDKLEFANGHVISEELMDNELDIIRAQKSTKQKIILSNAINLPDSDMNFRRSLGRQPDGLGFNIYYRVPKSSGGYYELTKHDFKNLEIKAEIIKAHGAEPIIFESQAEPWENGAPVHLAEQNYYSSNPEVAMQLASKLGSIGYRTVLLWGSEYWIYQANRGNTTWLESVKNLAQLNQAT